jgi:hypothetical protein
VEDAISGDPDLALAADFANLEKHFQLDRPPRSGHVPAMDVQGTQAGSGEGGWRLVATITHHGQCRDGLDVAQAILDAWHRHLTTWGLLP